MAEASTANVRIAGGIQLAMAILLAGIGVWLTYIALSLGFRVLDAV